MTPHQTVTMNVQKAIMENPNRMLSELASSFDISEAEVICMLPHHMRTGAPVEDFATIWKDMTEWEKITFIALTPGAVVEYSGKLPEGTYGHGMYNLHQPECSLGGHLLTDKLGSIWFLSKPHFGKASHSVQFYTKDGQPMCSIYVGRGDDRELLTTVMERFCALRNRYIGAAS